MEDLERVNPQGEQASQTSEQELKEPTSPEAEPTSEEGAEAPTFSQEDIDKALAQAKADFAKQMEKAVADAKAEVQSAKDKEIAEARRKFDEAELAKREQQELEAWGDTTEVKAFQEERRKHLQEKTAFEQERAVNQALAARLNEQAKIATAKELSSKYGVDESELLKAQNPSEMETIALKLGYEKVKAEREEKPPTKIDSSTPSTTGIDWRNLSPDEKLRLGSQKKK